MRNDAHDEPDNELPNIAPDERLHEVYRAPPRVSVWPLWVVIGVLLLALLVLGVWAQQQFEQLSARLTATQTSFVEINEAAVGRIKDISGQVVASESNLTSEREALRLRIRQLEERLVEFNRREQAIANEQQSGQKTQEATIEQLLQQLRTQQEKQVSLESQVVAQASELAQLHQESQRLQTIHTENASRLSELLPRLAQIERSINELQKTLNGQVAWSAQVTRIEEELLIVRSQLDALTPNRPR